MDIHLNTWSARIDHPFWYFLCALLFTIAIRLIMSTLNAWVYKFLYRASFREAWWIYFTGINPKDIGRNLKERKDDPVLSDFWLPTGVGFLELISYPVLLEIGLWSVIGAWIGFKTVAQWRVWTEDRSQFNRYLIGNALAVIISFWFSIWFVGPLHH
jgi:uncharacterized membrane protein HdeD (DUF308 family)